MQLKRTLSSILTMSAMTIVSTLFVAAPASAGTTYSPTGGPEVRFEGANLSFTVVQANQTFSCTPINLAFHIVSSGMSRSYGDIAGISGLSASGACTNPLADNVGPTTVTKVGAWGFTITGDKVGTSSPARLTQVALTASSGGCSFDFGGAVNGSYDEATQRFIPDGTTLKITSVPTGFFCPIVGLVKGQDVRVGGSWKVVPQVGSGNLVIANP